MHVSKSDHENCSRTGEKKRVVHHENDAVEGKKTPLPEGTLNLHNMSAGLLIARDGHLRPNTLIQPESALARIRKKFRLLRNRT